MSDVTIAKNDEGAWCAYIDGKFISDHRTYDGAAASANRHRRILAAPSDPQEQP